MRKAAVPVLLAVALLRFAQVAYSGLTYNIGDFYSTLPGAYVETLNPTLWASPDLTDIVGRGAYHRGPTQYLTAYPLSFLDSYRQIATVLLAVYAVAIAGAALLMWRIFPTRPGDPVLLSLIVSTSLLFYPTLQAYVAREFELIIMFATVLLYAAALAGREAWIGAWAAYLSLYKFLPLALLPYLAARRWWRALAAFAVTAAAMLAVAHALFGLQHFSSDGFVQGFASGIVTTMRSTQAFCDGPWGHLRYAPGSHDVSVRVALCGMATHVALPVVPIYAALIAATLAAAGYGFWRLERAGRVDPATERSRRTFELSIVVAVYTTFFLTHYYYLTFLIVPLTALLVRAYEERRRGLWLAWAAAYLLLSVFLLPVSAMTRWLETDVFVLYLSSFAYLAGELILLATLLVEYVKCSRGSTGSIGSTG